MIEAYNYLIEHTLLLVVFIIVLFGIGGIINDYLKRKK